MRWPALEGATQYEVRLTPTEGTPVVQQTRDNWAFLERTLAPGSYTWQARYAVPGSEVSAWSEPRRFEVPADAPVLLVPDIAATFAAVEKLDRPRSLPPADGREALLQSLRTDSRSVDFAEFAHKVAAAAKGVIADDTAEEDTADDPDDTGADEDRALDRPGKRAAKRRAYNDAAHAVDAAYAALVTGDAAMLAAARQQVLALAGWDLPQASGGRVDDLAMQRLSFSLALIYDLLHEQLTAEERERIARAIVAYTQPLFERYVLDPERGLAQKPQNSHGFRHAGSIAAVGLLMAGELDEARDWVLRTLPLYVAITNPWGGDDGGFANGTNYAVTEIPNHLAYWDIIRNTTGVDLGRTGWGREFGRYLFSFLPPGAPVGVFGDGADADHYYPKRWARAAALYAQRVPTPLNRLYAEEWGMKPALDSLYLFAPLESAAGANGEAVFPCDGVLFPSIGWVAMHSALSDPARTSVYFKSSSYGSLNHSHADQNSFVIHAHGVALAIDSGYYDSYRSKHEKEWTIQTKAHNAITFDGGEGQKPRAVRAAGRIVSFRHTPAIDVVTGDATRAYGRALQKARRTLVYIRPGIVLVYDLLESLQPRQWEWNIHSLARIQEEKAGRIRIESGDASLCATVLAGPPSQFTQDEGFPVPPKKRKGLPTQWHGRFAALEASQQAEFLVLLSVGCDAGAVSHSSLGVGQGFAVSLNGKDLVVNSDGATPP
jgi:hypothetical protein